MADSIKCSVCGREQVAKPRKKGDDVKLPPGWKRHFEGTYCRECWKKAFVLRAIQIPIGSVIEGGTWAEFCAAVTEGWHGATDVSNWAVMELAKADTPRTAAMERMPKFKAPYLYPGAREVAPKLGTSSVVAVLHAVEQKYSKARLNTIWFRKASLPVYRYPVPLPISSQGWDCMLGEGGKPCVSIRLAGQRWVISLNTADARRQLAAWRKILSGEAVAGELAIMGREARKSDHRPDTEARARGGGRRTRLRHIAKMVAWFPREEAREREGVLYLTTGSDHLWAYRIGTAGEPKYLHAAHVRRWERQHRRHLEAMSDDLKHELRWPADVRRRANERQHIWVQKYRDRLDSFTHEATAMIAGFADRNKVRTVVYDDTNKSYVDRFPWRRLRDLLKYKLDGRGIALEVVAASDTDGDGDKADGDDIPAAE